MKQYWDTANDKRLTDVYNAGMKLRDIAEQFKFSKSGIVGQIARLGLPRRHTRYWRPERRESTARELLAQMDPLEFFVRLADAMRDSHTIQVCQGCGMDGVRKLCAQCNTARHRAQGREQYKRRAA